MATTSIEAITSTAASAFAIGRGGATNPVFQVDCSVSSAATGVRVKGNAAGAGVDLYTQSSGTNENLRIDAKGSGTITLGNTSTGAIALARNTAVTGTLAASGDFAIATNKFTIAASSGNAAVAGTLGVTGATTLSSTLGVTGNVSVNTNKFTVAASSGNTACAGTLACATSLTIGAQVLSEANLEALLELL